MSGHKRATSTGSYPRLGDGPGLVDPAQLRLLRTMSTQGGHVPSPQGPGGGSASGYRARERDVVLRAETGNISPRTGGRSGPLRSASPSTTTEGVGSGRDYSRYSLKSKNLLTLSTGTLSACLNIVDLDLSCNKLEQLPHEIGSLSCLVKLNVNHNQLRELPPSIGNLSALRWLYVRDNNLVYLPEAIGQLSKLHGLSVANNSLLELPKSLLQCTELRDLNLAANQLTALPRGMESLQMLRTVYLYGNPWSAAALKTINLNFATSRVAASGTVEGEPRAPAMQPYVIRTPSRDELCRWLEQGAREGTRADTSPTAVAPDSTPSDDSHLLARALARVPRDTAAPTTPMRPTGGVHTTRSGNVYTYEPDPDHSGEEDHVISRSSSATFDGLRVPPGKPGARNVRDVRVPPPTLRQFSGSSLEYEPNNAEGNGSSNTQSLDLDEEDYRLLSPHSASPRSPAAKSPTPPIGAGQVTAADLDRTIHINDLKAISEAIEAHGALQLVHDDKPAPLKEGRHRELTVITAAKELPATSSSRPVSPRPISPRPHIDVPVVVAAPVVITASTATPAVRTPPAPARQASLSSVAETPSHVSPASTVSIVDENATPHTDASVHSVRAFPETTAQQLVHSAQMDELRGKLADLVAQNAQLMRVNQQLIRDKSSAATEQRVLAQQYASLKASFGELAGVHGAIVSERSDRVKDHQSDATVSRSFESQSVRYTEQVLRVRAVLSSDAVPIESGAGPVRGVVGAEMEGAPRVGRTTDSFSNTDVDPDLSHIRAIAEAVRSRMKMGGASWADVHAAMTETTTLPAASESGAAPSQNSGKLKKVVLDLQAANVQLKVERDDVALALRRAQAALVDETQAKDKALTELRRTQASNPDLEWYRAALAEHQADILRLETTVAAAQQGRTELQAMLADEKDARAMLRRLVDVYEKQDRVASSQCERHGADLVSLRETVARLTDENRTLEANLLSAMGRLHVGGATTGEVATSGADATIRQAGRWAMEREQMVRAIAVLRTYFVGTNRAIEAGSWTLRWAKRRVHSLHSLAIRMGMAIETVAEAMAGVDPSISAPVLDKLVQILDLRSVGAAEDAAARCRAVAEHVRASVAQEGRLQPIGGAVERAPSPPGELSAAGTERFVSTETRELLLSARELCGTMTALHGLLSDLARARVEVEDGSWSTPPATAADDLAASTALNALLQRPV